MAGRVIPWGEKAQILGLCLTSYYRHIYRFFIVLIAHLPFKVVQMGQLEMLVLTGFYFLLKDVKPVCFGF